MANLRRSKRLKLSREHSLPSSANLDSLHYDCLLEIFQYLSLRELLPLRYFCRSLNNAVCEYLPTSGRKLAIFLDIDRFDDEWGEVESRFEDRRCPIPEVRPFSRIEIMATDRQLFANQSHFRSEDFIPVCSSLDSVDSKVDSLILFLTNHMEILTEFALIINHELHFRSVPRILNPLQKLKILFIDVTNCVPDECYWDLPTTEVADAISGMVELECLYYFRSDASLKVFADKGYDEDERHDLLHVLSTGEDFVEMLLRRLRLLHSRHLVLPVGMTFDTIQEISISGHMGDDLTSNYFPALQTLLIDWPLEVPYSQLRGGFWALGNVKVLKIYDSAFVLDNRNIRSLNDLLNLEEMHCTSLPTVVQGATERNHTIVRLYSKFHPVMEEDRYDDNELAEYFPAQRMDEYATTCKEHFQGLRMFKNERPELVREFPGNRRSLGS